MKLLLRVAVAMVGVVLDLHEIRVRSVGPKIGGGVIEL